MEPPATAASVSGSTRLTRALVIVQVVVTSAALLPATGSFIGRHLALTPYRAVAWGRLWMLVTCAMFDRRVLAAFVNLPLFALAARPVELAFGAPALGLFLGAVTMTAALSVSCLALIMYAVLRVGALIFSPVATVAGLNLALLVAMKQQIPEHEVGFSSVKLRMNYVPLMYILVLFVLSVIGQLNPAAFFFSLLSFHSSWVYLRYFKTHDLTGARGDSSDAFAFATLFPDPIRPFVAIVSNVLHLLCRPILSLLFSSGSGASVANGGGKQDLVNSITQERASSVDAERRRQRAMKTLDERLAGSQSDSAV